MPFGAVTQLLGIASPSVKNAASFGSTVLRLPAGFPVYQQQMVRNQAIGAGPIVAAEWCGTADDEFQHTATLREASAHDTHFSRRNLSDPSTNDLVYHRGTYFNQIYYLNNEPDLGSYLAVPNTGCSCWNPRDRNIDQHVSSCFPNPTNTFWEPAGGFGNDLPCSSGGNSERIRANALAYVYLKLKEYTETILGRGHIVLPPSSVNPLLGRPSSPNLLNDDAQYWVDFYTKVHNGVTVGNCNKQGIISSAIRTIHLHKYTDDPSELIHANHTPLDFVGFDAIVIRAGTDWYRTTYNSGNPLDLDVLLSEMGYLWSITTPLRWAGGWASFRKGLSWWNSYLCWLTRRAPYECNLQGWDIPTGHRLHGCILEPNVAPYTTNSPTSYGAHLDYTRNQWCLNANTMQVGVLYN